MKRLAIAGLCAGLLAAPLIAKAAEYVLVDQTGEPVAVVVPLSEHAVMPMQMGFPMAGLPMQIGFPVANMFAQQDAMIRRMMSDFSSLPTMGAELPSGAVPGAGSTITISSFSSANGSCSRTVVYSGQANGGAPVMHVSQTGDACGALPAVNPQAAVPAAEPETERAAPPVSHVPGGTKLYQIDYRHHKAAAPALRG